MRDYEEKSYYEIQLDNKQLILVFLAGLVLCVLVFVLGVMVGKGQKEAELAAVTRPEPATTRPEPDTKMPAQPQQNFDSESVPGGDRPAPKPVAEKPAPEPAAQKHPEQAQKAEAKSTQSGKPAASKSQDDYSFYDLDKSETTSPKLEKSKATANPSDQKPAAEKAPVSTQPAKGGVLYTVQVMATASKPKAQQQMTNLRTKGLSPFLDEIKTESGTVYKVRVGKFSDSSGARELAAKLKNDLHLETWVAVLD
jgi:cell division septation protein DedD